MTGLSTDSLTIGIPGVLCLSASNELVKLGGVATCIVSSGRFKHDITPLSMGLSELMQMRPVSFMYNSDNGTLGRQVGFIAEEIEKIDPRLVVYDEKGLPFSVRYENMTAVLAKAIQELGLNLEDLASTTPFSGGSASGESFASRFFNRLLVWFSDAKNGIGDFFANRVHTKMLCVGDATEGETCITKSQLDALIQNRGHGQQSAQAPAVLQTPEPELTPPPTSEIAPEPEPTPPLTLDVTPEPTPTPEPPVPVVEESILSQSL